MYLLCIILLYIIMNFNTNILLGEYEICAKVDGSVVETIFMK